MPVPARVENITTPFPNGIIYDTGEQEFGAHDLQVRVYSGTLEVEGLEVHTGMLSEFKSLDAVPKTTVNTIVDGAANSYFHIQGTKTVRSETLGDGGWNVSTVQWDSVDYTGVISFQTVPNSTYMIVNGTMGPEYSRYSINMSPLPPGAIPVNGGKYTGFQYSPYRNPGAFYFTPLDPQVQYAVSIQGTINEATESTAFTPGSGNIHSVTFYAGTKKVDPTPANTTSTESEAPLHGESPRASRNAKIIGGSVGGGVGGLLLLGLLAFCCLRHKKKPSPVVSDPTPFEIDSGGSAATRTPSENDDEEADKVADELTPAQVAKAREAGFLGASEAGVSAVPSSVLDPEATTVPDSSSLSIYKPNVNMTVSVSVASSFIDFMPDENLYGNHTHLALFGEWNWTTSNPPHNLSTGSQTAIGPIKARKDANPNRRTFGLSNATLAGVSDGLFAITNQFNFAGTRGILKGSFSNANWDNATQPPMVVTWINTTALDFSDDPQQAKPLRIQNVTTPFPDGIIYDTGELEYGRWAIQISSYSGTIEVEGLDIETGFVSEYPSLDQVPQTTIKAVDDNGNLDSFFTVQGPSTVLNEVLGDGSANGSTVQWNSVDYTGTMTFRTQPNATYMIVNGTLGPEYDVFQITVVPLPPAAWVLGNDNNRYCYGAYRNPSALYVTPLDPKLVYTVSILGGTIPNVNALAPRQGLANLHSVTFFAGSTPPNITSTAGPAATAAASHGESRASRNAKIIGGAVGGGVGLLLIIGLLAFCCIRRKRKPSPVISDPTPFEIDGSDRATRVPSEDDESADKVAEELTPAQVAKAREAGFLGAGAAEAGVSAVPSSALDPRGGAVPFSRGPASAVPSSVVIPYLGGPASVAASSSLEPSDAVDSRFYGASSSTGAGSSSAILSPTSTQVNGVAVKDGDAPAILATPVHGDKRVHQEQDGGAVDDDDENVDRIPPSYNPSWASRGATLADSGAVTRVVSNQGAATVAEVDEGLAEPPVIGRLSIDSETFGRAA
ncbi:uncharacterized protein LOC62_01G001748 [Vanrija pseudolonga]|uniref:Uncharacterized protein n=1 Tax=Vanrija pseudolonga TaxID=143232 RepID=A0AAF0Y147_9TREE|nr:hypothetical protein LOC62_01G001748 [Vanrija pseudolonga]